MNLICRLVENNEVDEWEQYVEQKPTIAWQSYGWSKVLSRHYDIEFLPVAAFNENRICGIMPLYKVRSFFRKIELISVPYAVGGGIVADNQEVEKALINKAIDIYTASKASRIVFKQYKHRLSGPLQTDDNFYNKELNLKEDKEIIFANLDPVNKLNVNKAAALELQLTYPSNDLDGFYKLLLLHHKNAGIPCERRRWIQDLINFKMYQIALLKHEDRIVAGTLVKEHKQSVSFPFTSLPDDSERSYMFAYALYWRLIQKFADVGKSIFHSGRIPKTNETLCYRLGWGGQKFNYFYQYYPAHFSSASSEFLSKRGRKREILGEMWKKLPIGITRILGPIIVRYYP